MARETLIMRFDAAWALCSALTRLLVGRHGATILGLLPDVRLYPVDQDRAANLDYSKREVAHDRWTHQAG
jgi:hypothetical protein